MRKKTSRITVLFLIIIQGILNAQDNYWKETSGQLSHNGAKRLQPVSKSTAFKSFSLDFSTFSKQLETAPLRGNQELSKKTPLVTFPDASGAMISYEIKKLQTMDSGLAAKYPEINSYMGTAVDDPTKTIRFTVTSNTVNGVVFSELGTSIIDAQTLDGLQYKVYYKDDIVATREQFRCLTTGKNDLILDTFGKKENTQHAAKAVADGKFRTFRIALATTGEFSQFYINRANVSNGTDQQKKAAVIAGLNVLLNRLNSIYESEFAITMVMVVNNDDIVFLDPNTDGFTNDNPGQLIRESQNIIDNTIGTANYDIGHTMSTKGGGLATLAAPCNPRSKAEGITGTISPIGDTFVTDLWAHEIGHQYGGSHTFNNSCENNRNNNAAVEPGSGSSIMAYAGICPPNIQQNSDAYFHGFSHKEISNFITNRLNPGNNCGVTITNNNNNAPVIVPIPDYTIPNGTPFVLTASATDIDNDVLTYGFDQMDSEIALVPPAPTATSGPTFRSRTPTTIPMRYLPALNDVLNGDLAPTWEVLPTVPRAMNFTVTVRDNRANLGGQSAFQDFGVNFASVGPFRVTSQSSSNIQWTSGEQQTITWDVAGTTVNGINTSKVNILLSTNGGVNFDRILAENTPNDGSQEVIVPNLVSGNCRIMVQAVDNIFYALNSEFLSIGKKCLSYTNNSVLSIPDDGNTVSSVIEITEDISSISELRVSVNITHGYIGDLKLSLAHPNGNEVVMWNGNCENRVNLNVTFDDNAQVIPGTCLTNVSGSYAPVEKLSAFSELSSKGSWTLKLRDQQTPDDGGQLINWSIDLCSSNPSPLSLSTFDTLSRVALYPNPNKGKFIIDFGSTATTTFSLQLYDLKGREVFSSNYSTPKNSINLQGLISGIYLIKITSGAKEIIKKIVIN